MQAPHDTVAALHVQVKRHFQQQTIRTHPDKVGLRGTEPQTFLNYALSPTLRYREHSRTKEGFCCVRAVVPGMLVNHV